MNILIISQVFVPDMAANAILSGSLARHLLGQGHRVTVLAGPPLDIQDEDAKQQIGRLAMQVRRSRGMYTKRQGLLMRLVSFARLYLAVLWHALFRRAYEVVIVLTEPPMIYLVALLFKLTCGARLILWSMDCYPAVAVEAGVIRRGGLVHRVLQAINRWGFAHLDAAVALDDDMAGHLAKAGAGQVTVIRNWEFKEDYAPVARSERNDFRASLGLHEDDLFVLYLGNMGVVHEFTTVLEAIKRVAAALPTLRFVFIGGGVKRAEITGYRDRHGLAQLIVKDFIPKAKTRIALGSCDLGLVTLKREMAGLVTPSKLYGYLAMGVPVAFVGPPLSEVGSVIGKAGCGSVFEPGNVAGLCKYLIELPRRRTELQMEGARGRALFLNNYEASVVLPSFDLLLEHVMGAGAGVRP